MATTYTFTTNTVASNPNQYFVLTVTFDDGTFTWNVVPRRQDGQTGNVTRNNIYGLTVTIGGNQYYKGDINWQNYTVGSTIYNGTTKLSKCTVDEGVVKVSVKGNYWYGTWNSTYTCSKSGSIAIVSPTVSAPTYVASNTFSGDIVGGYSSLAFSFSATPASGGTITKYRLFQDGVQVYSGATASCTLVAPNVGTHSYYVIATESNGATGQSSSISVTTEAYTPPSFVSLQSVRWSTGDSSGVASDDGEYARLTPTFNKSSVGNTDLTTVACKVYVGSTLIGTVTTSGTALYTGQILTPDNMYEIRYELYDSVSGTTPYEFTLDTAPIIGIDIITIGQRGLDLIHDISDGYGVAVGMKATAGYEDTALPLRVNELDASGNVLNQAYMGATPQLGTPTVTRSSGLTLKSYAIHTWGRVAQLDITLNGNLSASSGGTIFQGTIDSFFPVANAFGGGYHDTAILSARISTAGSLMVKTEKAYTFSTTYDVNVSITYLF